MRAFSSCGEQGLLSSCSAQASHHCGFSCCRAWGLGHGLSSRSTRAKLLCSMWDLRRTGMEPKSPELAGRFLTTGPPGKSCTIAFEYTMASVQFSSVAQSCPTLCDPMNRSTPGLPVHHSQSSPKHMCIGSVIPSSHLILCRPLFLLPPILPSIRVFSNELTLRMRWPKYWSFSFSISPFNEHPGLISFRMD